MRRPFLCSAALRQPALDVTAMIRRDALQPADRDGLLLDAPATASGLARPVADAAENAGEDVRLAIQQVGVAEPALRDEPDVLRNVGVRRARPLAIDNAVKILGPVGVGRIHQAAARP